MNQASRGRRFDRRADHFCSRNMRYHQSGPVAPVRANKRHEIAYSITSSDAAEIGRVSLSAVPRHSKQAVSADLQVGPAYLNCATISAQRNTRLLASEFSAVLLQDTLHDASLGVHPRRQVR